MDEYLKILTFLSKHDNGKFIKNQYLLRFDNINTKKQANQPMETPNIKTTIGGWLLKYWWGFIIPIIIVIIGLIIENYYFKN